MDAKVELSKFWKDLSESAREFASLGLQAGSRALDYTAQTLKSVEGQLKKTAEKIAPAEKAEGQDAEAPKGDGAPKAS